MAKRYGILALAFLLCLSVVPLDAIERGDWLLRGRIIHANAENASDDITGMTGAGVRAESSESFELDLTYALTRHLSLELSVTDVEHDMEGTGTLAGTGNIADFRMLPATLTFQYRFLPNRFASPYVGAGVNYTHFHDVTPRTPLVEGGTGDTHIDMDDSWGVAAQVGVDLFFSDRWSMNFDIKYLDIESQTDFETDGVENRADFHIDPWVSGVGVGFRF